MDIHSLAAVLLNVFKEVEDIVGQDVMAKALNPRWLFICLHF
jgi:hypothetical protein